MTLDLDELYRLARIAQSHVGPVNNGGWNCDHLHPSIAIALIERVRAAEIVGSEWMALQEAAGFPKDGMVRSVKDVSDSVVLMAERLRELEKQCAENAAFAQKALEREVLGRSRIAKLEKKLAEAPANYENGDAFEKDITT